MRTPGNEGGAAAREVTAEQLRNFIGPINMPMHLNDEAEEEELTPQVDDDIRMMKKEIWRLRLWRAAVRFGLWRDGPPSWATGRQGARVIAMRF